MSITSKIDPAKNLITFIVTGKISSNEIVETIESFYNKQPGRKVLWDFRYADLDVFFQMSWKTLLSASFNRTGGLKTAIVASTDLWFSVAKMYAKFAEIKNLSHIVQIFRFTDEASKWLNIEK